MSKKFFKSVLILLGFCLAISPAAVLAQPDVFNGITYVLLSKELEGINGVYRLNSYATGLPNSSVSIYPIFNLDSFTGKVSGLCANQKSQIYLLSTSGATSDWEQAPVGWLPTGMAFENDSAIYLKIINPSQYGPWINVHKLGKYWNKNINIGGTTYSYAVKFGGPTEVKYLNGSSGTLGTPMWDGVTGIQHPTDSTKWILPSHWGAGAYYAYGTTKNTEFPGEPLDGTIGLNGNTKPTLLYTDADAGHESDKTRFSCVVKRIYKHRTKTLDLWAANDYNPCSAPYKQSAGVLSAKDIKVTEAYGKGCGDNCIPGGTLGENNVLTQMTEVYVFTSTRGNRYGFNPEGKKAGPFSTEADKANAALRVVFNSNPSVSVPYSLTKSDGSFADIITNKGYLESAGITPDQINVLGVSSNFSSANGLDFIYASKADKFIVQDSWWGRGGIAYEYFKETGVIQKLDFVQNDSPTPEVVGVLSGEVEDIGIDGEGYLYVMRNEKTPSDAVMAAKMLDVNNPNSDPNFGKVSTWLRSNNGGDDTDPTPPTVIPDGSEQAGDYKIVTIEQLVQKKIKRYAPATGALGSEENWGELNAGYDLWTRKIEKQSNGSLAWVGSAWSVEPEGERNSLFPGEMSVVNVAKIPEDYNSSPDKPHIIRLSAGAGSPPLNSTTSIAEGETLTLKIEGYKPFINGVRYGLKSIGNVVDPNTGTVIHSDLALNLVPAPDGTYNHDEDNDGVSSGFPSTMFESATKKTDITWTLKWIEGDLTNYTVLEEMDVTSLTTTNENGEINCKFPHPGNFILKANIKYNKFDYSVLATNPNARPSDLSSSVVQTESYEYLVKVYSATLALNQTQSYVSNITLKPLSRKFQNVTSNSTINSDYDIAEDKEMNAIEFSFDAQFVRDANVKSNINSALSTYDGVGVWDYLYYEKLYNEMKNVFANMDYSIPTGSISTTGHVYNYTAGSLNPISSNVNLNIYNPGWKKAGDNQNKHFCGTRMDIPPTSNDLRFIQWSMYLNPIRPPNIASETAPTADSVIPRGTKIAQGNCAESSPIVTMTEIGDRKYRFNIKVPQGRIEKIATPIDPETYALHLEIVYPRVSWNNSDLGDTTTTENRFSSLVPYVEDGVANSKPIHIISKIQATENGANFLANQSFKVTDGETLYASAKDYWNILVRDSDIPKVTDAMSDTIIQTTNDPVDDVEVEFQVSDNNPMADIKDFELAFEKVDEARPCDTSDANKPYTLLGTKISDVTHNPGPNSDTFYKEDSWLKTSTFKQNIAYYGPTGPFTQDGTLANWVGNLNYTAFGEIHDGIGTDSQDISHKFYLADAWNDIYPSAALPEGGVQMFSKAVTRIDNDPPTLEVELVSQIDNRRWVFKLEENEKDLVRVPTTPELLGKCSLTAACYNLQNNSGISSYTANDIEGCAAYPTPIGTALVDTQLVLGDSSIPAFRRSSRLLVNINITDNVNYKALKEATISITDLTDGANSSMLPANANLVSKVSSVDSSGAPNTQLDKPRARFSIDMPMKVVAGTNQVRITLQAKDDQGNERTITIPVRILDNTFNTRVLENKEIRTN